MRPRFLWFCGIVPLFCLLLAAQSSLIGPVEGFVFDAPSRSLRAVVGLVGSSSFGPILVRGVDYASVAPRKDYAIAVKGDQVMFVSGLGSGSPTTSTFPSTVRLPEGVVWSGDGSRAILYSLSDNWIQEVTGLPGEAAPRSSVEVTPFGGSLSVVAADHSGHVIAIGMRGDSGGLYVMNAGHGFAKILSIAEPLALAFSDDGLTLYALDGATTQVSEVSLADSTSRSFSLDGLTDPIAVAVARDSANRQLIYVAGRQDRVLRTYDGSSNLLLATVPLGFQPSTIAVFGNNSYILGPRASATDPLWSFRAAPAPAVYFVPAAPLALPEGRRR